MPSPIELDFPLWLRLAHWFNALFMYLLAVSGLGILAAHPKLYWHNDSAPSSEWLKLGGRDLPSDRLWCSTDEEVEWPWWLVLPRGDKLGLARYWHFFNVLLWITCGVIYVILLFSTDQWMRLVPRSWTIIPDAWYAALTYLHLKLPTPCTTENPLAPYNALQQLTYFVLIFFLVPFQITMGVLQSPSLMARFPWVQKVFLNRQAIRSLHFLGLVAFAGFVFVHLLMVFWHGWAPEMQKMILALDPERTSEGRLRAALIGVGVFLALPLIHWTLSGISLARPRAVHRVLSGIVDPVRTFLLHRLVPTPRYKESDISPLFRSNGYPPITAYPQAQQGDQTYERLLASDFADYRLEVGGLVETPLSLSLDDLRRMPKHEQITLHICIQGWSSIGKWGGVHVSHLLDLCQPLPHARYLAFWSFGFHEKSIGNRFYECIDLKLGRHPATIIAYELNGEPIPLQNGAPARLRVETKLGFKMVKFLHRIELVEDFRKVGEGQGGVREDHQQYDMGAEI